jgi:VIT1/CCC1 family predicted Fe2+/Mn2+ transporter
LSHGGKNATGDKRDNTTQGDIMKKTTSPNYSILTQLRSLRKNKLAAFIGILVGAVIPVIIYRIAHNHVAAAPALWMIVAGGLVFSGTSVYSWGLKLFGSWYKAGGFTVLLELTTVFIHGWESYIALGVLIAINATNMAHALVVGNKSASKRK